MPTPRKPVALQTRKMGKAKRAAKEEAEIKIGEHKFIVPPDVKADPEAHRKWREVTKIYKDNKLKFVTTVDTGTIARYCLAYSEYLELIRTRRDLAAIEYPDMDDLDYRMTNMTIDEIGKKRAQRLFDMFDYFMAIDGLLKLDKNINSKQKTLLDFENVLFLHPLARIRAVPVEKAKPKDPAADDGFDV